MSVSSVETLMSMDSSSFTAAEFLGIVGRLKPINTIPLLYRICTERRGVSYVASHVVQLLELHGLYWDVSPQLMEGAVAVLRCCFLKTTDFFEYISKALRLSAPEEDAIRSEAATLNEDGLLSAASSFLRECGVSHHIMNALEGFAPAILAGACALLLFLTGKNLSKFSDVFSEKGTAGKFLKEALSDLKHYHTFKVSMNDLWSDLMRILGPLLGFTYRTPDEERLAQLTDGICNLRSRVRSAEEKITMNFSSVYRDGSFFNSLHKAADDLDVILRNLTSLKCNTAAVTALLQETREAIRGQEERYKTLLTSLSGKQQPTTIFLHGAPGSGKSAYIQYLVKKLGDLEGRRLSVYTHNATDKFFSGYAGQDVFVFDDFGASKNSGDGGTLMHLYTPSSSPLNMADLKDKGIHFSSRYVIGATNMAVGVILADDLTTPEALLRRRDFVLEFERPDGLPPNDIIDQTFRNTRLYEYDKEVPGRKEFTGERRLVGVDTIIPRVYAHQVERNTAFVAHLEEITMSPLSQSNDVRVVRLNKRKIVLLLGAPGSGKSYIAKLFRTDTTQDDVFANVERYEFWRNRVLQEYDEPSDELLILTSNMYDYKRFLNYLNEDQVEAFTRRLEIFYFSFKTSYMLGVIPTGSFNVQNLEKDPAHFDSYVNVTYDDRPIRLSAIKTQISSFLAPPEIHIEHQGLIRIPVGNVPITATVPYTFSQLQQMSFTEAFVAAANIKLEGLSKMTFFKFFKPVVQEIQSNCSSYDFTVEECLLDINRKKIVLEQQVCARVNLKDHVFVVLTNDKNEMVVCLPDERCHFEFDDDGRLHRYFCGDVSIIDDPVLIRFYSALLNNQSVPKMSFHHFTEEIDNTFKSMLLFLKVSIATWATYMSCQGLAIATEGAYDMKARFFTPLVAKKESPPGYKTGDVVGREIKIHKPDVEWKTFHQKVRDGMKNDAAWAVAHVARGGTLWSDLPDPEAVSEGTTDPSHRTIMDMFANQNYSLEIGGVHHVHGQMIFGRVGVTVGHANYTDSMINMNGQLFPIRPLKLCVYADILIFEVDSPKAPMAKDLRKHISKRSDLLCLSGYQAVVSINSGNGRVLMKDVILEKTVEFQTQLKIPFVGMCYGGTDVLKNYKTGTINTMSGDCGSPVTVVNSRVVRKFIGVHMAGNTSNGYCNLIYEEDFADIVESESISSETLVIPEWSGVVPLTEEDLEQYRGPYEVLGRIGHYENGQRVLWKSVRAYSTKQYLSPFGGLLPNDHEPAVLHHKDERLEPGAPSPYYQGMDKWYHPQPIVDMELLDEVSSSLADYLVQSISSKRKIGMWTKKQAINGDSRLPTAHALERKTSPGFPEGFHPLMQGKKKQEYFQFNEKEMIWNINKKESGNYLSHIVDDHWASCLKGEEILVVFSGALKDEVLPLRKIGSGKTRSFTPSPTYFTINHRRAFGAAAALITENFHCLPIKVGINPASQQWNELAEYLLRCGDYGFDADYKNFDSSIPKVFMQQLPRIWNALYKAYDPDWCPEDDLVRNSIHRALEGPYLLYGDFIVRAPGGHVSGQPATSIDNCFVNCMYYLYIWIKLARKHAPHLADVQGFIDHVAFAVYGDDNVCTIKDEVIKWFNFTTFKFECELLNLEITPADKVSSGGMKHLRDMEFLKRSFCYVASIGKWVGPLHKTSMAKMLNWCQRKKNHVYKRGEGVAYDPETIDQVVASITAESSLHGEDFYVKVKRHIIECYEMMGRTKTTFIPMWKHMFRRVYFGDASKEDSKKNSIFISVGEYEKDLAQDIVSQCNMADSTGNNPPMPSTGGSTGAIFSGTDSSPVPLSNIAAAPAPTIPEASPHAGAVNVVDPYFYNQFVGLTQFTWTTGQQPGTLLWSSEITPRKAHVNLQYLSKLYNIWVGGLDYQVKIAGTGFHAGALAVVRLPPNINPQSLVGTNQFTAFDYVVIDPKTLEAMMKSVMDQRQYAYHYLNDDLSLPGSIGGYIAVYVMLRLNTSSSGSNQIDVQVFNKASMDFGLIQIIPTNLDIVQPAPSTLYHTLFEQKELQFSPYCGTPITDLIISTNTLLTSDLVAYMTNVNTGKALDGFCPVNQLIDGESNCMYFKCISGASGALYGTFHVCDKAGALLDVRLNVGTPATTVVFLMLPSTVGSDFYWAPYLGTIDMTGDFPLVTLNFATAPTVAAVPGTVYGVSFDAGTFVTPQNATSVAPPVRESFVLFQAATRIASGQNIAGGLNAVQTNVLSLTTVKIGQDFATRDFAMSSGDAALLSLVDQEFNTPVLYLKLYADGYFTASETANTIIFDFSKYQLSFVGYIRALDPIPSSTSTMLEAFSARKTEYLAKKMEASLVKLNKQLLNLQLSSETNLSSLPHDIEIDRK